MKPVRVLVSTTLSWNIGGSARVQRAAAAFKGLLPCFPVYAAAQRYLDMTLSDPAKHNVWSRGLKQLKKDAIKSLRNSSNKA